MNKKEPLKEFKKQFGADSYTTATMDVTKKSEIEQAIGLAVLTFGGIDLIVNNAGLSISKFKSRCFRSKSDFDSAL